MSTLGVAVWGNLPSLSPICLATMGYLCGGVVAPPAVEPKPEIQGTGGGGRYDPGYTKGREDALRETRRRRILAEDEELTAMIMSMVTNGLL